MSVRYAVLLKIHYWDDFIERRLRHLLSRVHAGDVYVFVDETRGAVGTIPYDRVLRAGELDMAGLGLLAFPMGQVFWYNVDYPLYYFYSQNPSYDYYLMCEHDAVLNINIDSFVDLAYKDGVDYVGFPCARSAWPIDTCKGVYPQSFALYQWLNCISLFSRRSVEFLLSRRQILSLRFQAGEITTWPNNEGFIPTEMFNNSFVVRKLGDFGKVDKYDWWPPSHENDLPVLHDQAFLHPVLDDRKYVASCIQQSDLGSYFVPNSELRRLLKRSMPITSIPALFREFARRVIRGSIFEARRPSRSA
jgi:hypothetical protein